MKIADKKKSPGRRNSRANNTVALAGETRIVVADTSGRPAITITPSQDFEAYDKGRENGTLDSTIGRLGSTLQAAPSLFAAGEAGSKQLMEVVVNGDLVRAADGNGFRAIAMGPKGVKEHARLFDPERLQNVLNAGAVWQVASVIVAQKHLADISKKLDLIAKGVNGLSTFLNDQRRSQIEAAYSYLDQARTTLERGEIPASVRIELESCERDLLAIQTHLFMEIRKDLGTKVQQDKVGTEEFAMGISRKIRKHEALLTDLALCIRTRICAWHVFALFPGEPMLKEARRSALQRTIQDYTALSDELGRNITREIEEIDSYFNFGSTLERRRAALKTQTNDTVTKIRKTGAAAERMIGDTTALLTLHDAPASILLQFRDGTFEGAIKVPEQAAASPG